MLVGHRITRHANYRKLSAATSDAQWLLYRMLEGRPSQREECWDMLSDYGWRRARRMLMAAGILNERGQLLIEDQELADDLLAQEQTRATKLIERNKVPAYLTYTASKRKGGS